MGVIVQNRFIKITSLLYTWILSFALTFHVTSSQLCDSKDYAANIEEKLRNKIGDKYSITRGGLLWLDNFTAMGNNPSGPYGIYIFSPSNDITLTNGAYDILFYAHDAIVFAGCTPPQSKYFSTVPYLYNQYNVNYTNPKNKTLPRTVRIASSLGAALNHLLLNTTNDNPFNSLATIINTADNVTYTNIYNALHNKSTNDINLQRFPHDYFNFAPYSINRYTYPTYPLPFDSYLSIWRIEIPVNYTQFYKYTKSIQPVFYLKYKDQQDNFDDTIPFQQYSNTSCTRDIRSNISVVNETKLFQNDLIEYVNDLAMNISLTYNYSVINISQMQPWGYAQNFGYECIDNVTMHGLHGCGFNNPDSVYYNSGFATLNITDEDYYIIIGVNSFNNNLTVYQNVNYVIHPGKGTVHGGGDSYALPDGVLNNFQYNNSAIHLEVETNVSKLTLQDFYVLQYARSNSFIRGIMGFNISYKDVNTTDQINLNTRNYLHPLTKTKPNYLDLVSPMFITFKNLNGI